MSFWRARKRKWNSKSPKVTRQKAVILLFEVEKQSTYLIHVFMLWIIIIQFTSTYCIECIQYVYNVYRSIQVIVVTASKWHQMTVLLRTSANICKIELSAIQQLAMKLCLVDWRVFNLVVPLPERQSWWYPLPCPQLKHWATNQRWLETFLTQHSWRASCKELQRLNSYDKLGKCESGCVASFQCSYIASTVLQSTKVTGSQLKWLYTGIAYQVLWFHAGLMNSAATGTGFVRQKYDVWRCCNFNVVMTSMLLVASCRLLQGLCEFSSFQPLMSKFYFGSV